MNQPIHFSTSWHHRLLTVPIMLFFTGFIFWASVSEIDESVHGSGIVVPSSQTKIIQHLEGGIIQKIYIKEGQRVKKNEPLFKLSQAFFLSDQKAKEIDLLALHVKEIRLEAEIKTKKKLNIAKSYKLKIPEIVANENRIFQADKQSYKNELQLLQDTINKKTYELKQMKNKLKNLSLELKIAKENVAIQERLVKQGASSRQMYLEKLAKKQTIITQRENIKNSIPVIEEELKEAKQKFANYQSKQKAKLLEQLQEVKIKINKMLQQEKASTDREVRKTILSPVDGTVKKLYFHTIGGIVKPGDGVVEITPLGDSLLIQARIKTSDRARVWIGQKVSVTISAFDFSRYGSLEGTLIAISPDSFTDKQNQSYYEVKVQTKKASFGKDEVVLAGMTAEINILTGKRTIMEYILKPMKDIKNNALREH